MQQPPVPPLALQVQALADDQYTVRWTTRLPDAVLELLYTLLDSLPGVETVSMYRYAAHVQLADHVIDCATSMVQAQETLRGPEFTHLAPVVWHAPVTVKDIDWESPYAEVEDDDDGFELR